jgi:hypothetical protein
MKYNIRVEAGRKEKGEEHSLSKTKQNLYVRSAKIGICEVYFNHIYRTSGVFILENTFPPPPWGEGISADVIWGKIYEKGKIERGKM